jgi:hypothetical protein
LGQGVLLDKPVKTRPEKLVQLLWESLKTQSADRLREYARACLPSASEEMIHSEVFFLHKFLLVQACACGFEEDVVRRVVSAFYNALDADLLQRMGEDALMKYEEIWLVRANEYQGPFYPDYAKFLERQTIFPWKGITSTFTRHFTQTSHTWEELIEWSKARNEGKADLIKANLAVSTVFGMFMEVSTEIILENSGQNL